ncbi:MAG: hydantoinase B/oxoprolinase family protein [Dehalococcoidia bacterium]|nr:hydantoinase B/oxoprolinase family protein [Dehalococcoidia bacterium]
MSFFDDHGIDPITFEIWRHRLFAINDEAAATLRAVSGSAVANEAYDFNTGILNATGEVIATGIYVGVHALTLESIVKGILSHYSENPGIRQGDMFICNDPYWGAAHQNDVALVAPIFWDGELIAWSGVAVHQIDMGGIVRGSQCCIGADSIYQEAIPIPPVKIVENNVVRKDIKEQYLRHCRFPALVELDLRAKIAANNTSIARIQEVAKEYGLETTRKVIESIIDYAELRFRNRLNELPDGVWHHVTYLEYEGQIHKCTLKMGKEKDRLIFDFRGSSRQARAVANCTIAGTKGGILTAILQYLCYDIPWSSGGLMRAIEVITEKGSIVDARWPAGVCKATTAATQAVMVACSITIAKMLSSSPTLKERAMAGWMGGIWTQEISGISEKGEPFNCVMLESMVGGGGALPFKDGLDTGGMLHAVGCCKANVETTESRYPIMYLYSRQQKDSGGHGKFRGGTGYSALYALNGINEAMNLVLGFTPENTEATGLAGGYPGGSAIFTVKQGSDIRPLLNKGIMPGELDEINGELFIVPPAYMGKVGNDDVWTRQNNGGGGFGDPILRDPDLVQKDVINQLISGESAIEIYGVVLTGGRKPEVDRKATSLRREEIKKERKQRFTSTSIPLSEEVAGIVHKLSDIETASPLLNEYLVLKVDNGRKIAACYHCGHELGVAKPGDNLSVLMKESPLWEAGRQVDPYHKSGKFVFRQICCPSCLVLLNSDIFLTDDSMVVPPPVGAIP